MPPQQFTGYFQRHDEVLTELEKTTRRCKKLETVYKEFELQKVCYLPLNMFLLKPIQRLVHYRLLLGRLCGHYPPGHHDYADCRGEWGPRGGEAAVALATLKAGRVAPAEGPSVQWSELARAPPRLWLMDTGRPWV